jgi:hypothetical protein
MLDPQGWAPRLGSALAEARNSRNASLWELARDSGGRFTARDLRDFERGRRAAGEVLSKELSDLYQIELAQLAPPRSGLEVDLTARVLRAGGAVRALPERGDLVESTLSAYLELVWALRGTKRTVVPLRQKDVDVLAGVLATEEEWLLASLRELMRSSDGDARRLLGLWQRRSFVVRAVAVVPAVAVVLTGSAVPFTALNDGGGAKPSPAASAIPVHSSPSTGPTPARSTHRAIDLSPTVHRQSRSRSASDALPRTHDGGQMHLSAVPERLDLSEDSHRGVTHPTAATDSKAAGAATAPETPDTADTASDADTAASSIDQQTVVDEAAGSDNVSASADTTAGSGEQTPADDVSGGADTTAGSREQSPADDIGPADATGASHDTGVAGDTDGTLGAIVAADGSADPTTEEIGGGDLTDTENNGGTGDVPDGGGDGEPADNGGAGETGTPAGGGRGKSDHAPGHGGDGWGAGAVGAGGGKK